MFSGSRNRRSQTVTGSPTCSSAASASSSQSSSRCPSSTLASNQRRRSLRDLKTWKVMALFGLGSLGIFSMDRYFGRALMENVAIYSTPSSSKRNEGIRNPRRKQQQQLQRKEQEQQLPVQQMHQSQNGEKQQQLTSQLSHQGGGRKSNKQHWTSGATKLPNGQPRPIYTAKTPERCAICFWGLPRAFSALVLPTLIENVLKPNAPYQCDFFVHYHYLEQEAPSRSGKGGVLNPKEVFELEDAVKQVASEQATKVGTGGSHTPVVRFTKTTEEDFFERRGEFINKTRSAKDSRGRYVYFPYKEKSYVYPTTTDNIIRMWDGLSAVSQLMKEYETEQGIEYTRVAMLRSDVAFVTPINIYSVNGDATSSAMIQKTAVVPGFAKWPVNDRMIYGPAPAVRIWAAERFRRIDQHVRMIANARPGHGMQDEYFLDLTIFPAIHALGIDIEEDESMCFLRTRVDESVWLNDCGDVDKNRRIIEPLIKRPCRVSRLDENIKKGVIQLECREGVTKETAEA
ncbi:hypothetical protein MPSEU_000400300 [Mayamaea pseudoterrestris]|nr:hypothetical protein MPSEU_000400300 [Mayamaea pseudoterrestris]